jgi:hypothetical protein
MTNIGDTYLRKYGLQYRRRVLTTKLKNRAKQAIFWNFLIFFEFFWIEVEDFKEFVWSWYREIGTIFYDGSARGRYFRLVLLPLQTLCEEDVGATRRVANCCSSTTPIRMIIYPCNLLCDAWDVAWIIWVGANDAAWGRALFMAELRSQVDDGWRASLSAPLSLALCLSLSLSPLSYSFLTPRRGSGKGRSVRASQLVA